MRAFIWVLLILDSLLLLILSALNLGKYRLSDFQLKYELAHKSDAKTKQRRALNEQLSSLKILRQFKLVLLGCLYITLFGIQKGAWLGFAFSLLTFTLIFLLSRLIIIEQQANKLFESCADFVIKVVQVFSPILKYLKTEPQQLQSYHSKQEFIHSLQSLPSTVLLPLERQRLELVLGASEETVKQIMTPKKRVVMVEPSATLGPIVLSDLQKTNHGYFPVVHKNGEPEGLLTLSDLDNIQAAKDRKTVKDIMTTQLAWVEEGTSLFDLAHIFVDEKQYFMFVKNDDGNFSGVVTLADFLRHVLAVVKE